jgi:hypothetical protein
MEVCTLILILSVSYNTNSKIIPIPVVDFTLGGEPGLSHWNWGRSSRLGVSISQFQNLSEALKESLKDNAL